MRLGFRDFGFRQDRVADWVRFGLAWVSWGLEWVLVSMGVRSWGFLEKEEGIWDIEMDQKDRIWGLIRVVGG